jgi:hypothetical protein
MIEDPHVSTIYGLDESAVNKGLGFFTPHLVDVCILPGEQAAAFAIE